MSFMNDHSRNSIIVMLVIALVLAAPSAGAQSLNPFSRSQCPQADGTERPGWVSNRFSERSIDRVSGVGSMINAELTRSELTDAALARARANLSEQLLVQVSDELVVTQTGESVGGETEVREEITRLTEQRTEISLPGLGIVDSWQDADNCELFVLVQLDRVIANRVIQSHIANTLYQRAGNTDDDLGLRLALVGNAIDIVGNHELGDIPGHRRSSQIEREYRALERQIEEALRSESLKDQQVLYERLVQRAANNSLSLRQRLTSLEQAETLVADYDLGIVYPNRSTEGLRSDLTTLKESIQGILNNNRHRVYVVTSVNAGQGQLLSQIVETLADSIPGTVAGSTCREVMDCMDDAIFSPAEWVTLVYAGFQSRNQGVFVSGNLTLDWEVRLIESPEQPVFSLITEQLPSLVPGRMLHRQQHQVTMPATYHYWLDENPDFLGIFVEQFSQL